MSRIGKNPVVIPQKVEVSVADHKVTVKGPMGTLVQDIDPDITVRVDGGQVIIERPTEQKRHKAMHGLYRSLIQNMVEGVSNGFKASLELVGVGFKATNTGQVLELSLGYSHGIYMVLPTEVKVSTLTEKGKNPIITLESYDKQLLGHMTAKIRSLRKVEPYKGKGVRFVGEVVRRKAGKSASK